MTCGPHHYVSLTPEKVDRIVRDLRRQASEAGPPPSIGAACLCAGRVHTAGLRISGQRVPRDAGAQDRHKNFRRPRHFRSFEVYRTKGRMEAFEKALGMGREKLVEEVRKSNLRGPAAARVSPPGSSGASCPKDAQRVYLVCNGDESEPGTFQGRVSCWGATRTC